MARRRRAPRRTTRGKRRSPRYKQRQQIGGIFPLLALAAPALLAAGKAAALGAAGGAAGLAAKRLLRR